jgi:epoxyqueuosine reductase
MEVNQKDRDGLFESITADLVGIINLSDLNDKDVEINEKVKPIMPGAQSVILLAAEVFPEVIKYFTSSRTIGDIHLSDLAYRNIEIVNGLLDWDAYVTVKRLHRLGFEGIPLPAGGAPFNQQKVSGVIPFGILAEMAGMGSIGWHSMLITPQYGARVRLSAIITDAALPSTNKAQKYYPCPECGGACIKICPVSAIRHPDEAGDNIIDRFKCNNMIESSGGCSECLKVCPAGQRVDDNNG